jgi:hypothetical protein
VELGESVVDSTQLVFARVIVSALAVLLLWLSSAAAVRIMLRSSGALPYTSSARVVDSIALLLNETARMRREYVECVVEQLEICTRVPSEHRGDALGGGAAPQPAAA